MASNRTFTPNWRNRTLWTGDNLHVMRGMNSASVDLIYLDPPFNSNQDYAAPIGSEAAGASFKDTWTLSDVDEAWHGEIAEQQPRLYSILNATGDAHGASMKSYLIMMAVRLLEMRRILKPAGSVYLHCDPTASHYLKAAMDAIFGHRSFRSEIVWKRTSAHSDAKGFGQVCDYILYCAKSGDRTWNPINVPHDPAYLAKNYRHEDERGRYRHHEIIRTASMGERPNLSYEYKGYTPEWGWRMVREKLEALDRKGLLVWSSTGRPYRKTYLSGGRSPTNLWTDIPPASGDERVGYPTQKPLALLDRIIEASSNEGDVVFDPFCGCATALVSADSLNRRWVGVDLSPLAAELVKARLKREKGLFHEIHHRTDLPKRADQGHVPHYRTHKHTLFGRQEGHCAGCGIVFPFRNFTVDHIEPKAHGGTDHLDNLQLLCNACNSRKGTKSQARFLAEMKADYGAIWEGRR